MTTEGPVAGPSSKGESASEADLQTGMGDTADGEQPRKSQKLCGGQVASQRHVVTEQKRRDKINEGYAELQQLLPCNEKVEKARLLMHAAEYVRQLQAAMQQLVDTDATTHLPEDLQYAIRKLLPPGGPKTATSTGTGSSQEGPALEAQDALAMLAEHAQQVEKSDMAEKAAAAAAAAAAAVAASQAPGAAFSAPAMPLLAGLLAPNPLLQPAQQANAQLLQQLQLQALQGGAAGLQGLQAPGLLAVPGIQNLLAGHLAQAFPPAPAPAAPAAQPAPPPGNEGQVGESGPAKRKHGSKARQHSSSAKLAKEEEPSPRDHGGGRPGLQPS